MAKKLVAGADFPTSQLVFAMKLFRDFMTRDTDLGLTEKTFILVGVGALPGPATARAAGATPGVVMPEPIVRRSRASPRSAAGGRGSTSASSRSTSCARSPG
jgi:methylenetetrahydrofolate reductase (NADPH)